VSWIRDEASLETRCCGPEGCGQAVEHEDGVMRRCCVGSQCAAWRSSVQTVGYGYCGLADFAGRPLPGEIAAAAVGAKSKSGSAARPAHSRR
jgi:hypothetical protein